MFTPCSGTIFRCFSTGYLALAAAGIELAEKMIAMERPSVIVHYGDLPDSGRAVIGRARQWGIPVILLQHGLYEETSHYFNHSPSDIGPHLEAAAPYCPLPDVSVVSDRFTAVILTGRGMLPARVGAGLGPAEIRCHN